ncbi:MAG: EutN/CcmL family microcompartment protein [Bacteroidota bacterium]
MKLGKVIGRVVCTRKIDSFEGLKLLLVQPVDENRKPAGDAFVAADTIQCGVGELVYYETSKEAGRILANTMNPADAAIMGIVDELFIENRS